MECDWRRASASAGSPWRASCRWPKCAPSVKPPIASWRSSSTARCAWRTPASVSRRRPGADAAANRGQCAQACRLPYEMMVDGQLRPLGDARYLLSPGDLYALEQVPEIVDIGISTLKIEGRYKDADYVALTTAAYRQAVDEAWAGRKLKLDRAAELRSGAGVFARPRPVLPHRDESSGGSGRACPAPSRRADGARLESYRLRGFD